MFRTNTARFAKDPSIESAQNDTGPVITEREKLKQSYSKARNYHCKMALGDLLPFRSPRKAFQCAFNTYYYFREMNLQSLGCHTHFLTCERYN